MIQDVEKLEDLPHREKLEKHQHYRFQDYPYNRAQRFLMSRRGQDWDKIISEFIHLDWIPAQYRTFAKLREHVEVNTFIENGKIYFFDNVSFQKNSRIDVTEHYRNVFYVHPKTKLLCFERKKKINWKEKYAAEEAKTFRVIGDYHQLLKLSGIWYEIKGEIFVPGNDWTQKFLPNERLIGGEPHRFLGRDNKKAKAIKIVVKKQLSSKQLKKFGLVNDVKLNTKKCPRCGGFSCLIHNI